MNENMATCVKIKLKQLCCMCLSNNRKLSQLSRRKREEYTILFKNYFMNNIFEDYLFTCWECQGVMKKFENFQKQIDIAQKVVMKYIAGTIELQSIQSLSTLQKKTDNFETIKIEAIDTLFTTDNFINYCNSPKDNIKEELEDDIPLAELQNYEECLDISKIEHKKNNIVNGRSKYLTNINDKQMCANINRKQNLLKAESVSERKCMKEKIETLKINPCDVGFKDQNYLDNHNLSAKSEKKVPAKLKTKIKVRKEKYRKTNRYKCEECNKCFETTCLRWRHTQKVHREGFKCKQCGKIFALADHLKRHEFIHNPDKPRQKCEVCNKMIRLDLFKVHSKIHSQRDVYSCAECDKQFACKSTYDNHLKYSLKHAQSTEKIFRHKCTTCDKGFRTKVEVKDHINYQHLGKTKHKCPICEKALATQRCVKRHILRAHEGKKERKNIFVCQNCGKTFNDRRILREHELIHSGCRPLACSYCAVSFRQRASLYAHCRRLHGVPARQHRPALVRTGDYRYLRVFF